MENFNFDNSGYWDLEPLPARMDIENIVKKFEYRILDDLSKAYMEGKISAYTYSKYECLLERDENRFYEQIIFGKIRKLYKEVKDIEGSKEANKKAYIGAYDKKKGYIKVDCSDSYPPRINKIEQARPRINKILKDLSKKVGKINEHIQGSNVVACCAEFRAINGLLNMGSNIKDIRFTRPFQYDSGKLVAISYCKNCQKMFQEYPHLLKRESECTDTEIEL